MLLLVGFSCALPMADLACPVLLQLTLCPLVVSDPSLFLSVALGHHRTQARPEPFLLSRMFYYMTALKNSATLGTKSEQPYVVSHLRTDHGVTCSLYSGTVNLDQRLLSTS